jgi:hypothetical protein
MAVNSYLADIGTAGSRPNPSPAASRYLPLSGHPHICELSFCGKCAVKAVAKDGPLKSKGWPSKEPLPPIALVLQWRLGGGGGSAAAAADAIAVFPSATLRNSVSRQVGNVLTALM